MKILVLGGAGFLGTALCTLLLKDKGNRVQVFDTFTHGFPRDPVRKANLETPIVASVHNCSDVLRALEKFKPEVVIHLAAYNNRPETFGNFKACSETNYLGTANVAHALISLKERPKKLIFASTLAAADPQSHFGISKRAAEDLLLSTFGRFPELGLEVKILRLAEIYGFSSPYTSTSLVNFLVDNMILNNKIALYGVQNTIDCLHIQDATLAFQKVLKADCQENIFDIGGQSITIQDLANKIKAKTGYTGELRFLDSPKVPIQSLQANREAAKSILGFSSVADLDHELDVLIKKRKKVIG